jgi:nucleoside-diphosphate-sugar epimerase
MIQHLHPEPIPPARVVVLGSSGFIGRHLVAHLHAEGIEVLPLSSRDVDLSVAGSGGTLARLLHKDDALVFASCVTPDKGKTISTMMRNLVMGEQVCAALQSVPCAHVVYISSDAVYADSEALVRETSRCEPSTLYGLAHITRERMVRLTAEASQTPWLVVRPTLIYGTDDTHNSYGPNRFTRQARDTGVIKLFGNGEEKRDHVYVKDAARLLALCLLRRSTGIFNLVSGVSHSFLEVAQLCAALQPRPVTLERLPRTGPITHRHFDVTALAQAFPEFAFLSLREGLAKEACSGMPAAA